jgi:methylglyoxal synthase
MNIALVAHDNKKKDLIEWCNFNKLTLDKHVLYTTGTTGKLIGEQTGLDVIRLHSGPLGGDQEIGSMIVNGKIDMLIFYFDPMESLAHDVDIKALLRLAAVYNIPTACNRSTADFIISSYLFHEGYQRTVPDYSGYTNRKI